MEAFQSKLPATERVLVAEGDQATLTHLRLLLPRMGYEAVTVGDGMRALEMLSSEDPPALAVLDWRMPGMDGIEVCRRLRQAKRRPSTYVILLTPWNQRNDRVEGLEAGADDCLFAPVDVRELRVRLQTGAQIITERALRDSEARFHSAFEYAGIGMAVLSIEGKFLQVNQSLCGFVGCTADELLGLGVEEIFHPDQAPQCGELLQDFLRSKQRSAEFERKFTTKGGNLAVWASLTISVVLDAEGNPSGFVAQIQDVDQRKQAEAALRRNEEFLRGITDNVNDLIFVVNDDDKLLYASPSHLTSLGYQPSELLGLDRLQLVHPDDRARVERATFEIIQSGQAKVVDLRMRHKNGSWRHLESHGGLLRNSAGDVEGVLVVARLMDERILAEQKLQAAYAETELFLQSIPSILIGLDCNGCITRWNLTAAKVLGRSSEEVNGKALQDCGVKWLHLDMEAEVARWLQTETMATCDNLAFEYDARPRFLGLHVRRIPSMHDSCAGFIVTGADITERKELEDQLRQAQKLEAIGQLAAGIAHEINTPTQYVGDNIRFLKDSWQHAGEIFKLGQKLRKVTADTPDARTVAAAYDELSQAADLEYLMNEIPHAIDQSLEGLERVSKIVRAIKEFSHPGSQEKREIDLNRAIETTVTVARNEWKYVADMELELDESLPLVPCIAGEFNQVILNLIVNAAHAIGDVVEKEARSKGTITIRTRRQQQWAEIAIGDTGGGIPSEIRSRVFEPFFTTKPLGRGTGQGLALAHSVIVGRHQGQIWFDSEIGKGTTFRIRLPLATQAATA